MTVVEGLQRALAVEHEVIYGYGVVGAHLVGPAPSVTPPLSRSQAARRLAQHLVLRDRIAALLAVEAPDADAGIGRLRAALPRH